MIRVVISPKLPPPIVETPFGQWRIIRRQPSPGARPRYVESCQYRADDKSSVRDRHHDLTAESFFQPRHLRLNADQVLRPALAFGSKGSIRMRDQVKFAVPRSILIAREWAQKAVGVRTYPSPRPAHGSVPRKRHLQVATQLYVNPLSTSREDPSRSPPGDRLGACGRGAVVAAPRAYYSVRQ